MFILPSTTDFLLHQLSHYTQRIIEAKTKKELTFLIKRVEGMTDQLTALIK